MPGRAASADRRQAWVLSVGLVLALGIALAARCSGLAAASRAGRAGIRGGSGQALYVAHCSSCHGLRGGGTSQGPPLIGIGPAAVDFMLTTGRMPMADPTQPMSRQPPKFSRAEIDALTGYLAMFGPGGPPIPMVHLERADLSRGSRLFAVDCAPCHGADGQGAAVGEGQVAPSLHGVTPTQIAEAVRIGPGPMPKFGEKALDARDLDALVGFVVFVQRAPDRGGAGLGHEGPVIEGFIAWLLGVGLMVAIARLIGTAT
jgi:quinol---cytochrome-c reductase cytochrome c subunit